MSTQHSGQTVKIDVNEFVNACKRNISRVSNKLNDYITNPDEKNIHDIRTSIRRLDACYKTLPKKLRTRGVTGQSPIRPSISHLSSKLCIISPGKSLLKLRNISSMHKHCFQDRYSGARCLSINSWHLSRQG